MKHAEKYIEAAKKILPDTLYPVGDAFKLVRKTSVTKLGVTVEAAMRLNIDPRRTNRLVRGTANLPHGTGKTVHVLVFAVGEEVAGTQAADAGRVGDDELIGKVPENYTNSDVTVTTLGLIGKVGRLGKVFGPRGLVSDLRTGTVTVDVAKVVKNTKGGCIEFHADRHANLQSVVGKAPFGAEKLVKDYRVVFEEVMRLRSSTVEGRYTTEATVSTTMGLSIPLALAEEKEA